MIARRAFTLLELVAVLVVLAVLGGIAVPKYFEMADRARAAADEAALGAMNTALHGAYMSHRVTDAGSDQWVTTSDDIAATMESLELPAGWTVEGLQLTDTRGNVYVLETETATASARIVPEDESGGALAGGGGGGGGGGGVRSPETIQAMSTEELLAAGLTPEEFAYLTTDQLAGLTPAQLAGFGASHIAALGGSQIVALSYAQFEAVAGYVSVAQIPLALPEQLAMLSSAAYSALTAEQLAAMTDAQRAERAVSVAARAIAPSGIKTLAVNAIKYLLPSQVAGITSNWAMSQISEDRRAQLTADQVRALNTAAVSLAYLTDGQRVMLTTAQMAAIRSSDIKYAPASRITDVPPATIAGISSDWAMSQISMDRRAAMSSAQVQALDTRVVSLVYLTDGQREQLTTVQMAAIRASDIRYAPAARISDIPPATLAGITSDWAMSQISADRRAALTAGQVQGINTSVVSLAYLTDGQRDQLTAAQMGAIRAGDIRYAPASRMADITAATFAGITSDWAMSQISADRREALTAGQVQALNTAVVSLSYLTDGQRGQLTTAQMGAIRASDIRYAPATRISDIPAATLAGITSDWAMSQISSDRRAAFTTGQVQGINTAVVSLSYLSDSQRGQLTTSQMGAIRASDIRYAPATRISDIPPATLAGITSDWAMSQISADRRAALTVDQVRGINTSVVSLSYLTEGQRLQSSTAQIASIRATDVRYVPTTRVAEVLPSTVAQITTSYAWSQVSTPQVQALTRDQVVAISAESYGYVSSRLTAEQRSWR